MKHVSRLLLIAGIAVALSACTLTQTQPDNQQQEAVNPAADDTNSMVQDSGESESMKKAVKRVTLDSFKYGYSQENIMVAPGDTVEVTLTNSDGLHDFVIDELNTRTKVIKEGETDTITFTIPADAQDGTSYEYYCSVMNHRALGMVGNVIVKMEQ